MKSGWYVSGIWVKSFKVAMQKVRPKGGRIHALDSAIDHKFVCSQLGLSRYHTKVTDITPEQADCLLEKFADFIVDASFT